VLDRDELEVAPHVNLLLAPVLEGHLDAEAGDPVVRLLRSGDDAAAALASAGRYGLPSPSRRTWCPRASSGLNATGWGFQMYSSLFV
jgi:hypothetical protein